jgi:hypothetical protein
LGADLDPKGNLVKGDDSAGVPVLWAVFPRGLLDNESRCPKMASVRSQPRISFHN